MAANKPKPVQASLSEKEILMKPKAAIAWKAGAPLTVEELNLHGAKGKLNIDGLITHTLPPDRISEGCDLMKRGQSIRSVVPY
jgi:Zn-dependent alcohol dehydrogenase